MTLPVPRSLQKAAEKPKVEPGTAVIQAIRPVLVEPELLPGLVPRFTAEFVFRESTFTVHLYSRSNMFPLSFPDRLDAHLNQAWDLLGIHPSERKVVVEWVPEFQSFCGRVFQAARSREQTGEWARKMVEEFLLAFHPRAERP